MTGAEERSREPLSGLVERVTFHSAETGFCVLRVKVRGHRDLVTVLGPPPRFTLAKASRQADSGSSTVSTVSSSGPASCRWCRLRRSKASAASSDLE
jgi:hypothetical protein